MLKNDKKIITLYYYGKMEYGFSHIVFTGFENSGANCREAVIACDAGENGNGSGKQKTGDSPPLPLFPFSPLLSCLTPPSSKTEAICFLTFPLSPVSPPRSPFKFGNASLWIKKETYPRKDKNKNSNQVLNRDEPRLPSAYSREISSVYNRSPQQLHAKRPKHKTKRCLVLISNLPCL